MLKKESGQRNLDDLMSQEQESNSNKQLENIITGLKRSMSAENENSKEQEQIVEQKQIIENFKINLTVENRSIFYTPISSGNMSHNGVNFKVIKSAI